MAAVPGPVVVKRGDLNTASSSDEGRVIRVIIPPGASLTDESVQAMVWKTELKQLGFARCIHVRCSLSFLSVKGTEAHVKTCKGFVNAGDFVVCPGCSERFKTFSTMAKHHLKAHGSMPKSAPMSKDVDKTDVQEPLKIATAPTRFSLSSLADESAVNATLQDEESKEALRQRILEESRRISTGRGRGRPRKSVDNQPEKEAPKFGIQGLILLNFLTKLTD